ncbi:MFS transporter [Saccharopolyspora sp.]|uniref:MFS transporter n=1 Tax=Saccharopolyspora sp. TaxID=33915 RepID=UPI0025EE2704|nr:MFS transporter [Saccharopolyspora sp.]
MTSVRSSTTQRLPRAFVFTIAFGSVLQALNASTMAVAMVDIRDDFDAGAAASWLISGLYLATAVGSPTAGRLADRAGPRRVFLVSLAITVLTSLLAPLAPDLGWLIAFRMLLGLGTCAAFPSGVAMLRAEADRRGMALPADALSALAIAGQVMIAFGPVFGGVLVSWWGWQAIFLVNVPLGLAVAVLAWIHLPADPPRQATAESPRAVLRSLDLPGAGLFIGCIAVLMVFLLSLAGSPTWWLLGVLAVLATGFAVLESRVARPFVDVRMLARNRPLTRTYLRTALTYVAFYVVFYGYPMWLQGARGFSADQAGLVVLPIALVAMASVALAGRMIGGSGYRPVLVIGSVALAAGGAGLAVTQSSSGLVLLLAVAAVLGVPNGFNNIGNQAAMYRQAEAGDAGMASGLYRTSQYVGANIAAAVIELGFAGPAADAGLHRLGTVVVVISAALLVGALLEWVAGRRRGGRMPHAGEC